MIRNLKALGLALVAVFAFSAMVASSASAQAGKLTSTGPVTLTGEDTGAAGANFFDAFGSRVTCPDSKYTGHKATTTPHQLVPNLATEVTVTPFYLQTQTGVNTANCDVSPEGLSATVTMNGCDYRLHSFTTNPKGNVEGTYSFLTDIVCPPTQSIAVHVYFSHSHTASNECVTLTIPAQTNRPGGHARNTPLPADDIDLIGKVTGIKAIRHNKNIFCPGNAETLTAEYGLDVTVKGHNSLKENTAVTITD